MAHADAGPLTNTPLTDAQISAFFNIHCCAIVGLLDGNIAGVHTFTTVLAGTTGTAAEGLFLYDYFLEDQGAGAAVRQFSVPFSPLVPFNFTGGGASTSAFCANCTGGTTDPSSSDQSGLVVSYNFPNGIGRFASDPLLVSSVGPVHSLATLVLSPGGASTIDVLAPAAAVAEPASLALLVIGGVGLAAIQTLARRHRS